MKTTSDDRLKAIYNYRNQSTSSMRDKLLDILLATATDRQIKIAIDELNIKIK